MQRWAEKKRRIQIIVTANLRKQWMIELGDKVAPMIALRAKIGQKETFSPIKRLIKYDNHEKILILTLALTTAGIVFAGSASFWREAVFCRRFVLLGGHNHKSLCGDPKGKLCIHYSKYHCREGINCAYTAFWHYGDRR